MKSSRRLLLQATLALPVALYGPRLRARPTPACGKDSAATPAQTAGPFYTPDSPEKADFRADDPAGSALTLHAQVLDTECRPLPGVIVDLWHADSAGRYDNDGFRLRGHQRADRAGAVRFRTVVPGKYPFRTRHFHVRLLREGRRLLTTQLYFPDEPGNARDGLFQPELLLRIAPSGSQAEAHFAFVVESA
jgi:protocatechuate 3,4-dioxygenase beta subunit